MMSGEALRRKRKTETHNYTIFRILRICMGLSLQEMAQKCGLSTIYLNELELGKKTNPSTEVIKKIAEVCDGLKAESLEFLIKEQKNTSNELYRQKMIQAIDLYAQTHGAEEIMPTLNPKTTKREVVGA